MARRFVQSHCRTLSWKSTPCWVRYLLVALFCDALQSSAAQPASPPVPLPQAHAHNDYEHARPLADALDHGFCSVEADIFLRDGQLLVAHDARDLRPERTLEQLYLQPLTARVKANGGRVYKDGPQFWLLIDQKTAAEPTYKALHEVLARYQDILTSTTGDKHTKRAVTVVISGNRPIDFIKAQPTRHAGIDGRIADLKSDAPAHLMPMISDNWTLHFAWRGEGVIPFGQLERLKSIVDQAHDRGRVVRFWATPETPSLWRDLRNAGVDLINTDKLAELRDFLLEK
jgi:glycerophosphoryl diester phosphodiesterase